METKIPVGILGATGMVGQQYIRLLADHPWFRVVYVAASPQSAGKKYKDALKSGWLVAGELSEDVANLIVHDVADVAKAAGECQLVFSAFEMPDKEAIKAAEDSYAAAGIPVFSNASAHRHTSDVPMLIAEINPDHLNIIPEQQKARGWKKGFIVVKPNCSLQSYLTPLYALMQAGYEIDKVAVTTMQAVSGAGYPGVASLDVIDNVIPFIGGEEEKTEEEPLKILGDIQAGKFVPFAGMTISAQCNRVPVSDGHLACVNISFKGKKPSIEEIKEIWAKFRGEPQKLDLPFAPKQPIIYRDEPNRPQPKKDRDADKGMAVSVGRLRPCPVFDYKFVALSHNTVRGAAGGGILNAELALKKGFL
ncbi:aspartate-semialdehyde dehydrogenase [Candidatus Kaiserbacteria bacterium CG10_big_fil_rev_8_21_14_0_10_51_14]|uniref:Aspartate-semialdehyde dehydrogenase n=1 Tax=Candidatus Kaiserbacteria bacterium CG10_big_fil_rev_8_21_14_0_10_51_14 TaxID=1974610 RepID=A0A2H0UBC4_9BACT|nr:MAG: aspartate-semialdehyde dehydrogenase [Candidatus Kaiserbacteria bacterium CG10_big_fil_rev_8_21_14_0_10_51_14]